ncbi:MAG: hypothetical protein A2036_03710 [Omnitrophica bacterium GWA2_50_21]|nr:MAG: hypothetical protein A2036_03710 [Omnitrophica bacterium GWA2_50_21]
MKNYLIVSNDGHARGLMTFAYFKKRLSELKLAGRVNVQLAGLMVFQGLKQDSGALKVLKKRNIPVTDFRVQAVNEELLGKADALVAVSEENHHYLRNTYAALPSEVRVLKVSSIIDGKEETYEKAFEKITEGLEQEFQSLLSKT